MTTGRTIFVGDVQGCRAELERLLEACRFDPAADRLEPVGDLVNRGPDSAGVLRVLSALPTGGVLGNHDVHALRLHRGHDPRGRRDTLDALLSAPDGDALLAWLAARPVVRALPGALLVHAGLDPTWTDPVAVLAGVDPLAGDPRVSFALTVRHCTASGERPAADHPPPGPPFRPWWEHWRGRVAGTLVFGHWARRGLVVEPGVRGLDTGCVYGGRLTAWIAEEDRLVSVEAERAWVRV